MNYFGKNILYLRNKRRWDQNQLATRLGYKSFATVSRWEHGANLAPMNKMTEIANLFGVSADELVNVDLEERDTDAVKNLKNVNTPAVRPLPILGTICAGQGVFADQNFEGVFFVDNAIRADFCIYVRGDSMIDANIYDGDIAMISKDCEFIDGHIYAVRLHEADEAVIKVLYWDAGKIVLEPRNKAYSPMIFEEKDITIIGMCTHICHETSRRY